MVIKATRLIIYTLLSMFQVFPMNRLLFQHAAKVHREVSKTIQPLSSISSLEQHIKPNSLVALDLDNTIFKQESYSDTDHACTLYNYELHRKGVSTTWAAVAAGTRFNRAQSTAIVHPVEPITVETIKKIQAHNTKVIAVTARIPELAPATQKQLSSIGIDFNTNSALAGHDCMLNLAYPARFSNGVLYCDHNIKISVILALLKGLTINIDSIIQLDDTYRHLKNALEQLTLQQHNLDYTGLHYTYLNSHKLEACKEIIKNLSLEEIRELNTRLGFSPEYIATIESCSS